MTHDLLNYVLDTFRTHGHAPDLRGAITGLPGEAFITLYVGLRDTWPTRALAPACTPRDQYVALHHDRPSPRPPHRPVGSV